MTKKECRNIAEQIAIEEQIIKENTNNIDAVKSAQERISKLVFSIENLTIQDIQIIDEMVQEILS